MSFLNHEIAMVCALSYLLGSIPFGLILTHLFGYGDIRNLGSGNIGATNVLRTGNKPLAFATLILDGGKGALAVFAGLMLAPGTMIPAWMGLAAIIGHCFPVWLKFKGGKGVATALGVVLMLDWEIGVAMLAVWLVMAATLRYSSLAAITAFITAPAISWFIGKTTYIGPLLLLMGLIMFNHRENMQRLMLNKESKIGQKKK